MSGACRGAGAKPPLGAADTLAPDGRGAVPRADAWLPAPTR
jgi:hypothetical protein